MNAIASAGITYAVTKACTMGNLVECSCDKSQIRRNGGQIAMVNEVILNQQIQLNTNRTRKKPINPNRVRKRKLLKNITFPEGEWKWGGCSDNVAFGFRNSRAFLDSRYRKRSDLRTLVKLHNNRAGRLVSCS